MLRIVSIIAILLVLSGCTTPQIKPEPDIKIEYKYIQKDDPKLPLPNPVSLDNINWFVVTPANIESVWEEMQGDGDRLVLFAVSPAEYKVLAGNTQKILNYIILMIQRDKELTNYYTQEE